MTEAPKRIWDSGKVWSEIRFGIAVFRERLRQAFDAASFEAESNIMDDVARRITARVEPLFEEHDRIVAEKDAEIARLKAERDEAQRRRDEWRAKAEGYDAVRLALREKVGTPWPPHMSRLLWAGIAADEKKRADDAASEVARLRAALLSGKAFAEDWIAEHGGIDGCDYSDRLAFENMCAALGDTDE